MLTTSKVLFSCYPEMHVTILFQPAGIVVVESVNGSQAKMFVMANVG